MISLDCVAVDGKLAAAVARARTSNLKLTHSTALPSSKVSWHWSTETRNDWTWFRTNSTNHVGQKQTYPICVGAGTREGVLEALKALKRRITHWLSVWSAVSAELALPVYPVPGFESGQDPCPLQIRSYSTFNVQPPLLTIIIEYLRLQLVVFYIYILVYHTVHLNL